MIYVYVNIAPTAPKSPALAAPMKMCIRDRYYKYQMDYQLDAVLQGKIDPLLLKKAGNASFDERLSVLSLLLARCRRAFAAIFQKRAELELLFGELKKLRMQLLEEEAVTCLLYTSKASDHPLQCTEPYRMQSAAGDNRMACGAC